MSERSQLASGGTGPALSVVGLSKSFGARVAFEHVSFEVGRGEVFGFLGPNGAGKTTTVRTLGTLIEPTEGTATVVGIPLRPENGVEIRRRIAIMPEVPGLYLRLSVEENLRCFPGSTSLLIPADGSSVRSKQSTWASGGATHALRCPRDSDSGSAWPGLCSATRRSSSSMNQPRVSTRRSPGRSTSLSRGYAAEE